MTINYFATPARCALASPWGAMTLGATDTALVWTGFDGQKHEAAMQTTMQAWPLSHAHPVLRQAAEQLQQYFAGERTVFDLPLDLRGGTPFQQSVWHNLLGIAAGTTRSYGAVAQAVGKPDAARAVGAAVGRNPISIIVPCHRVVGSSGALTGYAGGMERKVALLQLEGAPLLGT